MSDWPSQNTILGAGTVVINPHSALSLGPSVRLGSVVVPASTAWPSANRAFFIPFRVPSICTAFQMMMGGGSTATGNVDMGIYDEWGNRLTSSGPVTKSASRELIGNITDVELLPGLYYMAASHDGTANIYGFAPTTSSYLIRAMGVKVMNSAYTLPSTATFAVPSTGYVPMVSVWLRAE